MQIEVMIIYVHKFFSDFFESLKYQFQINSKFELHGTREAKRRTRGCSAYLTRRKEQLEVVFHYGVHLKAQNGLIYCGYFSLLKLM
jgi:hypothetical protein